MGALRVLYSFPHRLGADRICTTAWHQVEGLAKAGAEVLVCAGSIERSLPASVKVRTTLSRGFIRVPYKALGRMRALAIHDYLVAARLRKLAGKVDIVHTWPLGALRTLNAARDLNLPAVLERPNAHTKFAYEVVQNECARLGVSMPEGHEHSYQRDVLEQEEREYQAAYRLLCPSDFVARTFQDLGFDSTRILRNQYGFDDAVYHPRANGRPPSAGLSVLFVGGCAPRKGLHFALEAWTKSPASQSGTFLIAGAFIDGYREKLAPLLAHSSVRVLGHRNDIPELMRQSDILVLPSIEEGSALVTSEARGSGCVLLVSEAAGAICKHMENALVHPVGDAAKLSEHITMLSENRDLLERLRAASLRSINEITWTAAGRRLVQVYQQAIEDKRSSQSV
jgi:glycosyltransferase involved in cell wall biosynthesis